MNQPAPVGPGPAGDDSLLALVTHAWTWLGLPGRIAIVFVVAAALLWLLVRGLIRLGRGGRRSLLWGLTGACLVGFAGLGWWVRVLPEQGGMSFVMWHQLVRAGAALTATGFVVGFLALALPRLFNRCEQLGFVSFLAIRHVRASKSGFLTVISILSIAGVAVSSFALCAVISIMGGFGADLKRKILGNNAHIKLETGTVGGFDGWKEVLTLARKMPGVAAATPVAAGEAMASSGTNTAGVLVRGIEPGSIGKVIDLVDNVEVGKFAYLQTPAKLVDLPADEPIGLGSGGQKYLKGPKPKPFFTKGKHVGLARVAMGVLPRSRQYRIAGIFYSGMYEYDASQAYMLLPAAQEFLDLGSKVTGVDVKVLDAERVDGVRQRIQERLARRDLAVRDWKDLNKNLFSALKLEKIATFIILSIAIAVASFCIICTLLLMVTEKSKEIAILKAVGASDQAVLRVFMAEGMIIGAIGTVFGIVTGWVSMRGLEAFGLRLDPDVYYVDRLPILVDYKDYLLVGLAGFAITTLATVYPAISASRLRPVEGIRYE